MNDAKRKYLYISLVAVAAMIVAYLTYSLVAYGSPLIKSVNEHLISGNELHNDSLYEDAMIPYGKAYSMDTTNTVSAYNLGTNLIMKNYQDISSDKVKNGLVPDSIIIERYADAEDKISRSAEEAKSSSDKEMSAKANHNLGLVHHQRMMLKEAEAAYKEALRNDPTNENTRYNLAVVQYLMKQQQNQQNQDQQQQEQQEQQQNQQQEQQEQQQQEQQQQNQQQNQQQEQQDNKENYERMLEALMQDEKELREEMEEKNAVQGIKMDLEKNW